jgi:hypothetical protein
MHASDSGHRARWSECTFVPVKVAPLISPVTSMLTTLPCTAVFSTQPSAVAVYLSGALAITEFTGAWALEEHAKLFDRKRPQIVAMWCVENAVSAWEKVSICCLLGSV